MQHILPSKRTFRLFLRRIYMKANVEREARNLHECLEKTKTERRSCKKTFLICLALPTAYYLYLLRPPFITDFEQTNVPPVEQPKTLEEQIFSPTHSNIPVPKEKLALQALIKKKQIEELMHKEKSPTTTTTVKSLEAEVKLPLCVTNVNGTEMKVNTSKLQVSLDRIYPMVHEGGYYKPTDCQAKDKVAVIVPYRNRTRNLTIFLFNIHPFLMHQNLEYRIFIIEQFGTGKFNRGRLFNAGFKEMKKYGQWKCVVFHDVDLLPTNSRILYSCPGFPRHLSSTVVEEGSNINKSLPYLFGGVTSLTVEQVEKANGFSNMYWGWGGEDYDLFFRLRAAGFAVVRFNRKVAKYLALSHSHQSPNPLRYRLLRTALTRWQDEGLNSLQYRVITSFTRHLFTHIVVDINMYGEGDIYRGKETEREMRKNRKTPLDNRHLREGPFGTWS